MNRSFHQFFHSPVQSSYLRAVEPLWNLCQTRIELKNRLSLTVISAAPQTDFSHEGSRWN
jgi:hypothetical protein